VPIRPIWSQKYCYSETQYTILVSVAELCPLTFSLRYPLQQPVAGLRFDKDLKQAIEGAGTSETAAASKRRE